MKKKVLSVFLLIAMVFSLVACGGGGSSSGGGGTSSTPPASGGNQQAAPPASGGSRDPIKIAHITKTLTNPFFVKIKDAIEGVVKQYPGDEVITYDANNDINKEISIVEDCIAQKFDAVILAPIDYEGSAVSVNKLKEAGIVCVLIDSGVSNIDDCDFSVMSDNVGAGYLSMKGLAEAIGGKGKIVVSAASTSAPVRDRMAGRDKALAEYPDIEIVNVQDGATSVDLWMNFMANSIQKDPDIVGGWGLNDPTAQMFIAAIETAGKLDQIFVVGIDGSSESCDLIRQGKQLGTAAQFPVTMARSTAELLYDYITGGKSIAAIGGQQHIKIETMWVDKNNVDNFGEE